MHPFFQKNLQSIRTWFNNKPKQTRYLIVGIVVLSLWMLSGLLQLEEQTQHHTALPQVETHKSHATLRRQTLNLQGYTQANKLAVIKAQTTSTVEKIHAKEGQFIKQGQRLLTLAPEEKLATLKEARANLKHKKAELKTAKKLSSEGFQSKNKVKEAQAALKTAQAQLKTAQQALNYTKIYAPFDGIFEKYHADVGSTVQTGDMLVTFLSISPLHVIGAAPQNKVDAITLGHLAHITFPQKGEAQGPIHYVAHHSDQATRTYEVKVTLDNTKNVYRSGKSVRLKIPLQEVFMHKISPAFLSLSPEGVLGIKTVYENKVRFMPITLEETSPEGAWVSGLPEKVTLITLGHHFVKDGQEVNTTPKTATKEHEE